MKPVATPHLSPVHVFGPFHLDPGRRRLTCEGKPVALSARAFDILLVLIEERDRVVGREELIARVWPGLAVDPSNLTVQMSALRRALGDTTDPPLTIATIPGRGYRFIGPAGPPEVTPVPAPPQAIPAAPTPVPVQPRRRLPVLVIGPVLLLCGLGVAVALLRAPPPAAPPARLSIVVLPFRNLSDDRGKDYLADAISDDLTTDLARIPGSLVISRESADTFKSRALPAEAVGRALRVRYLVEGALRPDGDVLRINVQLIDTETGAHVWAERFDTKAAQLLDAQTDIVRQLANKLDIALVDAAASAITAEHRVVQDSRDLFLRARALIRRANTRAEMTEAQTLLEQAVAADPDYVDALAALGWLLLRKEQSFDYPDSARDDAEAERVIGHALKLAPSNPEVLSARGRFLASTGRCAEAQAAFDTALTGDPNNVMALTGTALCAWRTGDPERVIAALEATLRVDPQGPAANRRFGTLGLAALFAGHPAQAIAYLLRADAQEADQPADTDTASPRETTRIYLAAAYALAGDMAEARRRYAAYAATWQRRSIWRFTSLLTPAQSALPGFARITEAWATLGLPRFADEYEDLHVPPGTAPLDGGEFTPTPTRIPGGTAIETGRLKALLAAAAPPLVLDAGNRLAVPVGAVPLAAADMVADRATLEASGLGPRIRQAAAGPGIVVMGTGPSGIDGYNAALHLIALGYAKVLWYRGGEEAWAAAGLPARDLREP